ncbi:MAG: VanZ family protein [Traorella sp.]
MKKRILYVLLIGWICFIFSNSLVVGHQSSEYSQGISYQLYCFLNLGFDFEFFHSLIRKSAHFIEYLILGLLAYTTSKDFKKAMLIGVLVACFDETIQLFVDGRSGQFSDVVLDSMGVCCALGCFKLLNQLQFIHKD